jgi:hypothetical protein
MAITTGKLTVTTSSQAVDTSSPNPYTLIIRNESSTTTVHIGNLTLTAANGLALEGKNTITLQMVAGDQLHAITASGSSDISWMKIS